MLATVVIPAALPVVAGLCRGVRASPSAATCAPSSTTPAIAVAHVASGFTFLAHQAWLMIDAIARTLGRMLVHPAEPARVDDRRTGQGQPRSATREFYRQMTSGVGDRMSLRWSSSSLKPGALWFAAAVPGAVAGLAADRPAGQHARVGRAAAELSAAEIESLRLTARRTWLFFETFVGADGQLAAARQLPGRSDAGGRPSHVADEHRDVPAVDGRPPATSAGSERSRWSSASSRRDTIDKLEQFRGHLYNWYDTRDLRPLEPPYVSSVDSGNLAGHLLTVVERLPADDRSAAADRRGADGHR